MKLVGKILVSLSALLFCGCISALRLYDRGTFNPTNEIESDLAELNLNQNINVIKIDGITIDLTLDKANRARQKIMINSGLHIFDANYDDGYRYTLFPSKVVADIEKGGKYNFFGTIEWNKIKYNIINIDTNENVVLDLSKLAGNTKDMLSQYIKYILNPTMDEVGHTVILENTEYEITLKPDMIYSLLEKASNKIITGRVGFEMNLQMTIGKAYFLETDISKMDKEQFLNSSNYKDNAQIILVPLACTNEIVIYQNEKTEILKGKEIIFRIREIK